MVVTGGSERLPGCGNILRKGHAEHGVRCSSTKEWEPENRRRVIKECRQVREDNTRRKEQVPFRVVCNVVEIRAYLQCVFSQVETETVRQLHPGFLIEIRVG